MINHKNKVRKAMPFPLLLCLLSLIQTSARAQYGGPYYQLHNSLSQTDLPSPNATDLGKYGDIPVSHYTGRAEVSIPLYSFTQRGVTLDVGLSYDTSGLRVNQLPGCMGHGWTLNAGGCITRIVNYSSDEFYPEVMATEGKNYFQSCTLMPRAGEETLGGLTRTDVIDFEPDIFYFNFMGKTGYFLLGNDGNWKVCSESNLTVAFDAVGSIGNILTDTVNYAYPFIPDFYCNQDWPMSKTIRGFTLLDDDGTSYVFGGTTDAIEYSTDLFHIGYGDITTPWTATAWFLTEVKDRNGFTLYRFSYDRDYFMAQLGKVEYFESFLSNGVSHTDSRGNALSGTLNAPVSLNTVSMSDGNRLSFSYQNAFGDEQVSKVIYPSLYNQDGKPDGTLMSEYVIMHPDKKGLSKKFFYLQDTQNPTVLACQAPTTSNRLTDPLCSIGLRMLESINYENHETHTDGKSYTFGYDQTGRIHLSRIDINVGSNSSKREGCYRFEYDNFGALPADYLTGRYDHWGYYKPTVVHIDPEEFQPAVPPTEGGSSDENTESELVTTGGTSQSGSGTSVIAWFEAYDTLRNSSKSAMLKGSLHTIVYPTNGCTRIEYEPNQYAKYVSDNHLSLVSATGVAGGLRVKSIADYDDEDKTEPLRKRTYSYLPPGTNLSSGTLYARPKYHFYWNTSKTVGGHTVHMTTCRSAPVRPLSSSHGPHIGYSYVTETNLDGSSTVYHYSNIEDAMDGRFSYTLCDTAASPYDKFTERGYKRGRLLSSDAYDSDGRLMSSVSNTYRGDEAEDCYVYASNLVYYQNIDYADVNFYRGGTYKVFYPKYDLVRSIRSTRYGDTMLTDTVDFLHEYADTLGYRHGGKSFHANTGLLKSVTRKRGNVQTMEAYTYASPSDNASGNYFLPVLTSELRMDGNVQEKKETVYGEFNGRKQPLYDITYSLGGTVPDTLVHYLSYTADGRLRTYIVKGEARTTLLWDSYDRLVAKVVGNIDPDLLDYTCTDFNIDELDEHGIIVNVTRIRDVILTYDGDDIFSLENVEATVWGYDNLGNMACVRGSNGVARYFSYDRDGRLIEEQDADRHTHASYGYNFASGNDLR